MSTCQSNTAFNACPAWHTVTNLNSCLPTFNPPHHSTTVCQTNTAGCMNPHGTGMDARFAATAPVRPGKMSKMRPYPCGNMQSYAFNPVANECTPVPHGTPGAVTGPTECVLKSPPFVYTGFTY